MTFPSDFATELLQGSVQGRAAFDAQRGMSAQSNHQLVRNQLNENLGVTLRPFEQISDRSIEVAGIRLLWQSNHQFARFFLDRITESDDLFDN